eukprot:TRINITY_DN1784_c0_g1_i1.p1 TRINITY_DN1784_c0_g1~~TRINITY_DN1784_c0_g1_i1.p1  ORF type:complete len:716 (+),score=318.77 TRINITY_DN1784_c0_g1_i1:94-2148(+)
MPRQAKPKKAATPRLGGSATKKRKQPPPPAESSSEESEGEQGLEELQFSDSDGSSDEGVPADEFDQEELDAMSDSDEEEGDESGEEEEEKGSGGRRKKAMFGDDEHDEEEGSSSGEELDIEREARLLDAEQARIAEESKAEIATNLEQSEAVRLPLFDGEDEAGEDIQDVFHRIQEIARVLNSFRQLRDPARTRKEYMKQLLNDISTYYGYNEYLAHLILALFSVSEALEFLEANETPRPVTIRTNTLKVRRRDLLQALVNRGVNLEALKWSNVGVQVFESQVPLGATPEYLAGYYMMQGASSFLPVMALGAQENERVLDMCAAPGGKTTHIAAYMKNSGILWVNDSNKERTKAIKGNLHRMGVKNCIVSNYDARVLPAIAGHFDRVLVDAPCAGLGVISRDASIKVQKQRADIDRCQAIQKGILLAAIDCCNANSKTGGVVVYSTCSISVQENEAVLQHALDHRNVKVVDAGLEFGVPGVTRFQQNRFHPSIAHSRRFYPHTHNMDGFFVAKIVKLSNKKKGEEHAQQVAAAHAGDDDDEESESEEEEDQEARVGVIAPRKVSEKKRKGAAGGAVQASKRMRVVEGGGGAGKGSGEKEKKAQAEKKRAPPAGASDKKKKRPAVEADSDDDADDDFERIMAQAEGKAKKPKAKGGAKRAAPAKRGGPAPSAGVAAKKKKKHGGK